MVIIKYNIHILSNIKGEVSMRKNENKQERRNKGFTLVELIIVIAILAVIAVIAAPNLIGNINKSRKTADVANAKVIGEAVIITLAQKPELAKSLTDIDLTASYDADSDSKKLVDAVILNLQNVPEAKSFGTDKKFLVTVTAEGKVTVEVGTQQLYPDPGNYIN